MAIGTGHRSNNYSESKRNDHLDNYRCQEQRNKGIPNKSHPNFREEHKSFSSIFVSNIPWNASVQDLWDICNKCGVVIDVYIAAKRSKSGDRFGFIRFINVNDINQSNFYRWSRSCLDMLPEYMEVIYRELLDVHKEAEDLLEKKGKVYRSYYTKEMVKEYTRNLLIEAKWAKDGYIPIVQEHMSVTLVTCAYAIIIAKCYVHGDDSVTEDTFIWVSTYLPLVKALCLILRLMDDIATHKEEQERNHVASSVECYMKQYGVSEEQTRELFMKQVEDSWKVINQESLRPTDVKEYTRNLLIEAKWAKDGYIPIVQEHMSVTLVTCAYAIIIAKCYVHGDDSVTEDTFIWVSTYPPLVKALCLILRLMDDIATHKEEQERNHVASSVECYMKQYGVSEEQTRELFMKQVEDSWKVINQESLRPTDVPRPLLIPPINLARVCDVLYKRVQPRSENDPGRLVAALELLTKIWATAKVKKVNGVDQLQALIDEKKVVVSEAIIGRDLHLDDADGVKCLPNAEIFEEFARMVPRGLHGMSLAVPWHLLMVRNVDSPSKFLMYPRFVQVFLDHQVDDMTSHSTRYISPALTQKVYANMRRVGKGFSGVETPLFPSMLVQPQPQADEGVKVPIPYAQPSKPSAPSLTELQDPTLTPHNSPLQDQPTTPYGSFMPLLTTLMETCATLSQKGRLNQEEVDAASKGVSAVSAHELVSAAEPTVFDDEDVTITMAQTLIKLKEEKARILDEQIAQKLHDDESAVDKQVKERHADSITRYRDLKKKLVSIAQARKNMIIYLKNMASYKMEFFKGMTYDKVRPIFEKEYKKVQTMFKKDKDVQKIKKKRVADETLLQESFKKLRVAKVSGSKSTQEVPIDDSKEISEEDVKNILEIVPIPEFKVEALHVKYPIIDWEIYTEGPREYLVVLWNLVKEKFSSAEPTNDKERALWVKLKRLFEPNANDVPWKLQRYMHARLTWKLYSDSKDNAVQRSSRKCSKGVTTAKSSITTAGSTLVLLDKVATAVEDLKIYSKSLVLLEYMLVLLEQYQYCSV
uniref:(E)-beta-farnesene synthase-like n=1 Tax=Tanacetum cinerariifolium TaxID=118510 RepID=A0A6L2MUH5_TANCI|nr:(E)-beta-farnesene synthase-like [Tanacetum cinerariifolium]